MKAFVIGTGQVSALKCNDFHDLSPESLSLPSNGYMKCAEPDYKTFINPMVSRRMSRVVKMGIFAAKSCLTNAEIEIPDAIVTGTGLGCIEDTEKFLISIIRNEEKMLNPTPFIQSTHNTVSSQIALFLKCHGYNVTYSHRGHSFEHALLDSLMLLKEERADTVLVGGIDEITQHAYQIQVRLGIWKKPAHDSTALQKSSRGNIAGEGAAFVLLSKKKCANSIASVSMPGVINGTLSPERVRKESFLFLEKNGLSSGDVDLLVLGPGGDSKKDLIYEHLADNVFPKTANISYKHLCGDYQTVTSFATILASHIIQNQKIPELLEVKGILPEKIRNVLVYNHFNNINHSFLLLQNVDL